MKNVRIKKGNKLQGTSGDIWAMTWVGDVTYVVGNDSNGCPGFLYRPEGRNVMFAVMRGEPENCQVHTVNPMEQLGYRNEYVNGVGSWKCSGLVCVDGVLYLMLITHRYPRETKAYPWFTAYRPCIIKSEDKGATWSKAPEKPMFDDRFGNPSFIQFGKENENAPEGYVYAMSAGEGQWVNNSTCILGRVRKENIMNGSSWEFCCGISGGNPVWGKLTDAAPVIEKKESIGCSPEVIYNPHLKKYILMTFSAPYIKKTYEIDESWASSALFIKRTSENDELWASNCMTPVDMDHAKGTLFHVFCADNVWGPWENVYEGDGTGTCDYTPRIPLMWLKYGSDRSAFVVSSGDAWLTPDSTDHYGFVISKMIWDK